MSMKTSFNTGANRIAGARANNAPGRPLVSHKRIHLINIKINRLILMKQDSIIRSIN
jgi:hypothetical protein